MSTTLTRSRVSAEQLEQLLTFMEEHREFAAGKQSIYSRFSSSKLWRLLAERLNAAAAESGGARKSPDKWCRYWADIKYKARKKTAAGGALGELSYAEERLRNIIGTPTREYNSRNSHSDEDRKPVFAEEEMGSADEGIMGGGGGDGDGEPGTGNRLSTEELLAEAAMRSALAAEKQAEAVTQAVELLRDLVAIVRRDSTALVQVTHVADHTLQPLQHAPHPQHATHPQHQQHRL